MDKNDAAIVYCGAVILFSGLIGKSLFDSGKKNQVNLTYGSQVEVKEKLGQRARPALIFSYEGRELTYTCGKNSDSYELQQTIEDRTKTMFADVEVKQGALLSGHDKLIFTKDVIDKDSNKIITLDELKAVDKESLKPGKGWTKKYLPGAKKEDYSDAW